MAQKRYDAEELLRPVNFTDQEIESLAAGRGLIDRDRKSVEEHARPVDLTDQDVKARAEGKETRLEALEAGEALKAGQTFASYEEHARPFDLTEKDVEARAEGKKIRLEERPPLKRQY
jgi:hypothetical protein